MWCTVGSTNWQINSSLLTKCRIEWHSNLYYINKLYKGLYRYNSWVKSSVQWIEITYQNTLEQTIKFSLPLIIRNEWAHLSPYYQAYQVIKGNKYAVKMLLRLL